MQNSFSCQKCGAQNQIGARSCNNCGLGFQYSCPQCHYPIRGGDVACAKCGNTLSWPSGSESRVDRTKSPAEGTKKQRGGSWLGPLVGLLALVILGGAGSYVFIKLSERPPSPAIV